MWLRMPYDHHQLITYISSYIARFPKIMNFLDLIAMFFFIVTMSY